jgi:serine/threonine protein kinase
MANSKESVKIINPVRKIKNEAGIVVKKFGTISYKDKPEGAFAKKIRCKSLEDAKELRKESELHSQLKEFPKAALLYDSFIYESKKSYKLVLIMENCEKGDLQHLIFQMRQNKEKFSLEALWRDFQELATLFRQLQRINLCHRDIKPENIFITNRMQLKLGDFGESKYIIDTGSLTIRGTYKYLSPKLREAYLIHKQSGEQRFKANHNAFKSDVFSLGLVFLEMILVKEIDDLYLDIGIEANIEKWIGEIENPYMKQIVSLMLRVDEDLRPDFNDLDEMIFKCRNEKLCILCWQDAEESIKCVKCTGMFHLSCNNNNYQCPSCRNYNLCVSCGGVGSDFLGCQQHSRCKNCLGKEPDCDDCNGFEIIGEPENLSFSVLSDTNCRLCNSSCLYNKIMNSKLCTFCFYFTCDSCESPYHYGYSCNNLNPLTNFVCVCGSILYKPQDDIFAKCMNEMHSTDSDRIRCVYCKCSVTEKDHFRCSQFWQMRAKFDNQHIWIGEVVDRISYGQLKVRVPSENNTNFVDEKIYPVNQIDEYRLDVGVGSYIILGYDNNASLVRIHYKF